MSQESESSPTPPIPTSPPTRPRRTDFEVEFVSHVKALLSEILANLPELESVTIIPVWTRLDAGLPAAVAVGRGPDQRMEAIQEWAHLLTQLSRAVAVVSTKLDERLDKIEAYSAALAVRLAEQQQQRKE